MKHMPTIAVPLFRGGRGSDGGLVCKAAAGATTADRSVQGLSPAPSEPWFDFPEAWRTRSCVTFEARTAFNELVLHGRNYLGVGCCGARVLHGCLFQQHGRSFHWIFHGDRCTRA